MEIHDIEDPIGKSESTTNRSGNLHLGSLHCFLPALPMRAAYQPVANDKDNMTIKIARKVEHDCPKPAMSVFDAASSRVNLQFQLSWRFHRVAVNQVVCTYT